MKRREFFKSVPAAALFGALARRVAFADDDGSSAEIPRRPLGRTGERVSILGLGGHHVGVQDGESASIRIIRSALDAGVNFLDNCWCYNAGDSELRMGKALAGGYRDKAFVMSKIDGRTRAAAASQIDESLRRLRTDRIDLMQFHEIIRDSDPERIFGEDGAMQAMAAAQKAGKVRFIGFTGHKSPAIHERMLAAAARHDVSFDAVQMPLNVLDAHYDSFERRVLPKLVEQGIGVLAMKPLAGGRIARRDIADATACLHYAMSLPVSTVITGCDSMQVLEQALRAARTFRPLSGEQRAELLRKTESAARDGKHELYKTSDGYDSTTHSPERMG